jgi:uncharacterized protein with NAD-binding domain and iron-sulfur cluster
MGESGGVFRVAVLGGGVAGMSVAHELARRSGHGTDFEIHVFEKRAGQVGGKARSIPVPGSGKAGRPDLPGEHGFRFFPGFYKHLPDTMQTIPYGPGTVFDNLVVADRLEIARFDVDPIVVAARFPHNLDDLVTDLEAVFGARTGLKPGEVRFFATRMWQILTSCQERRLAEYEGITWAEYLQAKDHSPAYNNLLVAGLSRSLLANDPYHASARTVGDTNIQLLMGMAGPGHPTDRLLNGPTSMVWLEPWRRHLINAGVIFHMDMPAQQLVAGPGGIHHAVVGGQQITADAYVCAVPVERMADLLAASAGPGDPARFAPSLQHIPAMAKNVGWMNGIQFFLKQDVPITHGHVMFANSPWALTCISEAQFWQDEHLPAHGDGTVRGIISVCISDWDEPGILHGRTAKQCTRAEIAAEVWAQMKRSLNVGGRTVLADANLHSWFLDPDIIDVAGGGVHFDDAEPLFVNFINSWARRPEVVTALPNLLLASDYVRTYTDVACMEAANEAARRAVNAILTRSGSPAAPCELWPLHEPALLAPWRWHDKARFDKGLPWDGHLL